VTEHNGDLPEEDRTTGKSNKTGNRFTSKFSKNNSKESEADSETPSPDSESKPENPANRTRLFSTSERAPSHFVPKVKQNAESTTTTTSTTLTTSTTTVASTEEATAKRTSGKDLLSSIPIEDDVTGLLPAGFVVQPETSSVGIVQVPIFSKILQNFIFCN
jgi:hypothetical protein